MSNEKAETIPCAICEQPSREMSDGRSCGNCSRYRLRTEADKSSSAGYEDAKGWCIKLAQPTSAELLRCGGDDYSLQPGLYREGCELIKITICGECELPIRKSLNEYVFGYSDKGRAKYKEWAAQYKLLPSIDVCECAHNQEEDEDASA